MMIPPSPLKCIRAGGSQGCVGSFVFSGFFWVCLNGFLFGFLCIRLVYLKARCAVRA
jgi:hypothetical protein